MKLKVWLFVSFLCLGLGGTLMALWKVDREKRALDVVRAQQQYEFAKRIDDLWIDPDQAGVLIPAYQLRAIGGLPPRAPTRGS